MTTFRRCGSKKLKSARNRLTSIYVMWFYPEASFCISGKWMRFIIKICQTQEWVSSVNFQDFFDFISGGFLPFEPTVRRLGSRNWEDESYVTHRKVTFGPLRSSVIETPWKAPKSPLNKSYTIKFFFVYSRLNRFFFIFFMGNL